MSQSTTQSEKSPAATPDDFDFLFGSWRIHNRRLDDPFDDAESWSEFEAHSEAYPILSKLGNVQHFDAPEFPGRPGFQGYALRLLDLEEELWRIWWASTAGRGRLDSPVLGRFRDGVGQFDGTDVIDGREIGVRFLWTEITETSARWEQSFSFDGGRRSSRTGSWSTSASAACAQVRAADRDDVLARRGRQDEQEGNDQQRGSRGVKRRRFKRRLFWAAVIVTLLLIWLITQVIRAAVAIAAAARSVVAPPVPRGGYAHRRTPP